MKRILLRSPKDPFEVVSPRAAYARNLIGDNSGNLVFLQAAHRILAVPDVELESGGFSVDPQLAAMVNERYEAYVMPLANAFRISYEASLRRQIEFLEKLRIPVIILGVGAQSDRTYSFDLLRPIEPLVRRFVAAVLDRAPTIGVRGDLTAGYLESLGFRDIDVIGCPSMFMHGDRLEVRRRAPALDSTAAVSVNVSPYVKAMGPIVMSHLERYPNLTYVPQDITTLGMLIRGDTRHGRTHTDEPMPFHAGHPLLRPRHVRFYVEPWPWIEDMRAVDFSFGTRIHGNIAAILAGTPAFVLAHDSRTLELARYFEIPHRPMTDVPTTVDAAELYDEADPGAMIAGHRRRFDVFAEYLEKHGLRHVFQAGEDPDGFHRRVEKTDYPPAVTGGWMNATAWKARRRVGGVVRRIRRS